jgi:putative transposase
MASIQTERSEARWSRVMTDQQLSGLSQRAYCVREGLALSTFALWRRRLSQSAVTADPARFVEIVPRSESEPNAALDSSVHAWDIELDLGGGVTLRMRRRC